MRLPFSSVAETSIKHSTLSNRLRFSVRVYCNNAQMTSERVKNYEKVRHETKSRAVTFCSLHALASSVHYYSTYAQKNVIYFFYTTTLLFFSLTVAKRLNFPIRLRLVLKRRNLRRTSLVLISCCFLPYFS